MPPEVAKHLHDVLTALRRRFPATAVLIYPTQVQGLGAAEDIARTLALADKRADCDALILPDQTHDQWFNNTKTCYKSRPSYTLRVAPDRYPWLRQMDNTTVNLAGAKTWTVTEHWRFNLRAEAFNLLNHPNWANPAVNISTVATVGSITSVLRTMREVQFVARFSF